MEVFGRELTPEEVSTFYGVPAASVPASPAPLVAARRPFGQVTLNFADVANENGYTILRSNAAGGPFTVMGTTAAGPDDVPRPHCRREHAVLLPGGRLQPGGRVRPPRPASVTTPAPAVDPIIVYNFNENAGTRVEDISPENSDNDGTLAGDTLPEFRTTSPSPAGGSYLHFEGDGSSRAAAGAWTPTTCSTRSSAAPRRSATTSAPRRPAAPAWQSPAVTGGNPADGSDNIFWGSLDPEGRSRVQAGTGATSASTPHQHQRVVPRHTHPRRCHRRGENLRQRRPGRPRRSPAPGRCCAEFRAIGALTDVAADETTIEGYTYLNGDLDQVEIFDRVVAAAGSGPPVRHADGAVPAPPHPR